jgi:hypothetical protein
MHSTYGVYGFSTWSGKMLYARVAPLADCDRLGALTPAQRELCDPRPPALRPGSESYLWTRGRGPQRRLPDAVVMSFARRVVTHQPEAYLRMIGRQTGELFLPGRAQRPKEACVTYWEYPEPRPGGCRVDAVGSKIWAHHAFRVSPQLAAGLRTYGRADWPIGPVMLACLLATVAALALRGRTWRPRLDAAFLAVTGLGVTVAALATATFSYRYTLPLYSMVPAAAALAVTAMRPAGSARWRWRRTPR